jgi:hypothetical protein
MELYKGYFAPGRVVSERTCPQTCVALRGGNFRRRERKNERSNKAEERRDVFEGGAELNFSWFSEIQKRLTKSEPSP